MYLLLSVCFVVELGSKAWLKSSRCDPGCRGHVDPSTLGSADGPVDAAVIQDEVDPVTPDAIAPTCDGDPDDVAPKIPCEDALEIPAPVIPVSAIPGDADP